MLIRSAALALALAGPAAAQDYNQPDIVRGLCQKNGCDEFRVLSAEPVTSTDEGRLLRTRIQTFHASSRGRANQNQESGYVYCSRTKPAIMAEQHISAAEYSWITGAFQIGIMFQPLAGYVLDVVGLKIGFTLFVAIWSLITMAHGLATGWMGFAGLRGALGLVEGSAQPAGMKLVAEWFPARERGVAGGIYQIGASFGAVFAPPLVAWAEYSGERFVAAVENGPLTATQFHPEKSGDAGAALLRNWVATL